MLKNHFKTPKNAGKSLQRDELSISPELQEIIDQVFGNDDSDNDDDDDATNDESSGILTNTKFIQLSSIKQDVESTSADCYYPNNGNSVVFRETTV